VSGAGVAAAAGLVLLASGGAAGGCAKSIDSVEEQVFDGSGPTGSGTGGGGGAGGGTGGEPPDFPCGIDCTKIKVPDCKTAKCNLATEQCEVLDAEDGTGCDDGKFCTVDDACEAGVCTSVKPNDCGLPVGPCQDVTCDEDQKSCSAVNKAEGALCISENLCHINAKCQNGLCIGVEKDCFFAPVPNDCHVSKCNPASGMCEPEPGNEGLGCLDLMDLCTVSKVCQNGVCIGGSPKDCSSLTQGCVLGVCDTADGQCKTKQVADSDPCDDLNACTLGEKCSQGTCAGGTEVSVCMGNDGCCPSGCSEMSDGDCGIEVALGYEHTCAIMGDTSVRCWGYNVYSQLGDNTNTAQKIPVPVVGLSGAVSIGAGYYHSCAALGDGTAKCWGYNFYGQLGDNTNTTQKTPVAVTGLTGAVAIASGYYHNCAVINDGTVKCWGQNTYGQLGDGTTTNQKTPVAVTGLTGVVALAIGDGTTCALINDGTVKCWGRNTYGQLGNGTNTQSTAPVVVTGLSGVTSIAAGRYHVCARKSDSTVACWGYNNTYQLGNGNTTMQSTPVAVAGLTNAAAVGLGRQHSCAILTDGTAKCWGYNIFGELGNGTTTTGTSPTAVSNFTGGRMVAGGYYHTCATWQSGVRCWGYNNFGQLGNNSNTTSYVPVDVNGL
jgi:alpha-tubulin suppressor-like RCC1 family protein